MNIGIDARLINETGVGRYIRNLVFHLEKFDKENSYIIYLRKNAYNAFKLPNGRWEKRIADVPWHSFAEQIIMPWLFLKERFDIVHIPYFNIPILYPGTMVATIHDLTILHFDTGKATTLPIVFYKVRRLGYRIALEVGLRRVHTILTVSKSTRQEIIDHFHINPEKIAVTNEGVDEAVSSSQFTVHSKKRLIKEPYFLYVGNAYPHKNLEMLLQAFQHVISQGLALRGKARPYENARVILVFVGKDDYFYTRIRQTVKTMGLSDQVMFFGFANDSDLVNLYTHAIALVFPSLMEGFGLPGLEAMSVGTPVVCSDIPIFREIYNNAALFFKSNNIDDCAAKLLRVWTDKKIRIQLVNRGMIKAATYSWQKMAQSTIDVYSSLQ